MPKISEAIINKNRENSAALIPYITFGDPNLATTREVVRVLAEEGAAAIELGLPFTDPVADGPVIQRAMERSLRNSFSLEVVFKFVESIRSDGITIPIALYTYCNLIHNISYETFSHRCQDAGIDGVLIVDLPPEEISSFTGMESNNTLETIFLCSPTTSPERLKKIADAASGFTYYVVQKGVTGVRDVLPIDVYKKLLELREIVKSPIGVGFGISKPEHAKALAPYADAIVIGSAYVSLFERYEGRELLERVRKFTRPIITALTNCRECID
jgi:tryptophan synthase alpha chain